MRKITSLLLLVFGLFVGTMSAQVFERTFDTAYKTANSYSTWQKVQPSELPAEFDGIMSAADEANANMGVLYINNSSPNPFWIGGDAQKTSDYWLTHSEINLDINATYKLEVVLNSDGDSRVSYDLQAWETGGVEAPDPEDKDIFGSAMSVAPPAGSLILDSTFAITNSSMTFGFGVGSGTLTGKSYSRTTIISFKLTKLGAPVESDTIIYYNVGTKNSENNPDTYTGDSDITLEAPTDSLGYAFAGWFTDAAFNDTISTPAIATGSTGDTAFYAKWEALSAYTVSYNANGGTVDTTSEIVYDGDNPLLVATASRDGYVFDSWNSQADGLGTEFTTSSVIVSDSTVYAVWAEVLEITTCKFNGTEGAQVWGYPTINVLQGDTIYVVATVTPGVDVTINLMANWEVQLGYTYNTTSGAVDTFIVVPSDYAYSSSTTAGTIVQLTIPGVYSNCYTEVGPGIPTVLFQVDSQSFTLYPNPTNDVINIKGLDEGTRIELYSTSGILVKTTMNSTIDVSDLSQGIYYVKAGSQVKAFAKQ